VFQKEKLVNSKTNKDLQSSKKKLVQQELTWFIRPGAYPRVEHLKGVSLV
jgi:hypothetical protein